MNHSSNNSTVRDNFKNAKLLIIEDNADHCTIINRIIQSALPEVKAVILSTEEDALDYLNQCGVNENELPKLILLDLYLPDRQSGWRLLERIKTMRVAKGQIPVVILSSSGDQADVTEAYQRGCSSYVVKPSLATEWQTYFECLRMYWWETVTLPKVGLSMS